MSRKLAIYLGILMILLCSGCSKKNGKEAAPDTKSQNVNSVSSSSEGNYAETQLPQLKLESGERWFGSRTNSKN